MTFHANGSDQVVDELSLSSRIFDVESSFLARNKLTERFNAGSIQKKCVKIIAREIRVENGLQGVRIVLLFIRNEMNKIVYVTWIADGTLPEQMLKGCIIKGDADQ